MEVLRACRVLDLGGNHSLTLKSADVLECDHVLETVCLAWERTLPEEFMVVGVVTGACNARQRALGRSEVQFHSDSHFARDRDGIDTEHWDLGLSDEPWGVRCHFTIIIHGVYEADQVWCAAFFQDSQCVVSAVACWARQLRYVRQAASKPDSYATCTNSRDIRAVSLWRLVAGPFTVKMIPEGYFSDDTAAFQLHQPEQLSEQ